MLLEQHDLEKLQAAVCIYFFYNEFMENARDVFKEAQSASSLNPNEQVSLVLVHTHIGNLIQRLRSGSHPMPHIEAIVEVLLTKTDAEEITAD